MAHLRRDDVDDDRTGKSESDMDHPTVVLPWCHRLMAVEMDFTAR